MILDNWVPIIEEVKFKENQKIIFFLVIIKKETEKKETTLDL